MLYQEDIVKIEAIAESRAKQYAQILKKGFDETLALLREEMAAAREAIILEVDGRAIARAVSAESKTVAEKPAAKKEGK